MHQTLRAALLAACAAGALGCGAAVAQTPAAAAAAAAAANNAAGIAPAAPLFGRATPPAPAPNVVEAPARPPAPPVAAIAAPPAPAAAPPAVSGAAPGVAPVAGSAAVSPDAPVVSAEAARQTEAAVRAWIVDLVGPKVEVPARPIELSPAGDHYDAKGAIGDPHSLFGGVFAYTATARPQPGGIWTLDDLKQISPRTVVMEVPKPAADGKRPNPGSAPNTSTTPATTERITVQTTITGATGQARIDPSLGTPSTLSNSFTAMVAHGSGQDLEQDTTIGPVDSRTTLSPNGADRMDLSTHGTLTGYKLASASPQIGALAVGLGRIQVDADMAGISRTGWKAFVRSAVAFSQAMREDRRGRAAAQEPPMPRAEAKALLASLDGIMSTLQVSNTIGDLSVAAQGFTVTSQAAKLSMGGRSEAGLLQADMDLGMDGIALPGFPLGDMAALVPTSFDLQPFVSGVSVEAVRRVLDARVDEREPDPADVQELFAHGGLTAGLKSMAVAVGGASFAGSGQVLMRGLNTFEGTGTITAVDFDALLEKVQAVPAFAQAVPAIIFLKGIGRIENGKLTWHLSYNGNAVLVNGIDLSALAGAGKPRTPPATPQPGRAAPNANNPGGALKR